jgi:hypothetical protein
MKLDNPPGILGQNLSLPFSRKIAVQKRHVNRWRRLIRLHKTAATAKVKRQCKIWLVLVLLILCVASGFWATYLCPQESLCDISSVWAVATIPCDFILLLTAALSMPP